MDWKERFAREADCRNCLYFYADRFRGEIGQCRWQPRQYHVERPQRWDFPPVYQRDWCAHFELHPDKADKRLEEGE